MFKNISIIGDGGMGTVLAMLLREKNSASVRSSQTMSLNVRIWGYDAVQLAQIEQARENKKFLPGYKIPKEVIFESEDTLIMTEVDLIVSTTE